MPARKDETGNSFGKWTIIEYIPPAKRINKDLSYLAQCECGTIRPVRINDLRNGKSQSCGCTKRKDWNIQLGKTYGQLTVKYQLTNQHGNPIQQYHCVCSCGNEIDLPADLIGKKKNCGCNFMAGFDTLQDMIGEEFGRLTVVAVSNKLDNYGKRSYRICECKCGNIVEVQARHLRTHHTTSCGCLRSNGEEHVSNYLSKNHFSFQKEYIFSDLKDESYLRFDFCILKDKTPIALIEVQGKQHYQGSLLFSSPKVFAHDKMKQEYCKNHNLPLLLLDYSKGQEQTDYYQWDLEMEEFIKQYELRS